MPLGAVQEIKKEPKFYLPSVVESGYQAERRRYPSRADRRPGDRIAVVELTTAWVGTWTLTLGDGFPPSGFDFAHEFTPIPEWDSYYPLHNVGDVGAQPPLRSTLTIRQKAS